MVAVGSDEEGSGRTPWELFRKCRRTGSLTDFSMVDISTLRGSVFRGIAKRRPSDRETTAFPSGLNRVWLWTMTSLGPSGLEGVFLLPHSSRLNHDGADESNKVIVTMECEENLGLER